MKILKITRDHIDEEGYLKSILPRDDSFVTIEDSDALLTSFCSKNFVDDKFPLVLKSLTISCDGLASISYSPHTVILNIQNCPRLSKIESLPQNIKSFNVKDCESLSKVAIPSGATCVIFSNCPNLKELEGDLPSSLELLECHNCGESFMKDLEARTIGSNIKFVSITKKPDFTKVSDHEAGQVILGSSKTKVESKVCTIL